MHHLKSSLNTLNFKASDQQIDALPNSRASFPASQFVRWHSLFCSLHVGTRSCAFCVMEKVTVVVTKHSHAIDGHEHVEFARHLSGTTNCFYHQSDKCAMLEKHSCKIGNRLY